MQLCGGGSGIHGDNDGSTTERLLYYLQNVFRTSPVPQPRSLSERHIVLDYTAIDRQLPNTRGWQKVQG